MHGLWLPPAFFERATLKNEAARRARRDECKPGAIMEWQSMQGTAFLRAGARMAKVSERLLFQVLAGAARTQKMYKHGRYATLRGK
jgi:hypothetical protein